MGGSGTDVFTETLAEGLRQKGLEALATRFAHRLQYSPWLLSRRPVPENTDIVLANTWNAFAFKKPGTKLIAVEHLFVLDPALAPYKSWAQAVFHNLFVKNYEKASQRNADQVVAVSQYTGTTYRDVLRVDMPRVILNGIDTDFFCPLEETIEKPSNRPFRLLFVGNMSRRKGVDMLPDIMAMLGSGYELSYTQGLRVADPFPSLQNVRRLGRLDRDRVREEYRRADLLLFPTRLEGLPLVAMEAMACGTPVIASDTASLPEVIDHGETGMLCRLNDGAEFVLAIRALQSDPAKLQRLAKNARMSAINCFSIDRMINDYVYLFTELVNKKVI